METRVNYMVVGLFVILLSLAGIVIAVWLLFGATHRDLDYYYVYISESVAGLNVKAPVRYSGVDVGFVSHIGLSKRDPEKVRLTLAVNRDTPVSVDTRAQLDTQGFTGMAFLELSGGSAQSAPLKAPPGEKYPVIQSDPSLLFKIDEAIEHLTSNVENISKGLSEVLSHENTEALKHILEHLDNLSTTLSDDSGKIDSILTNLDSTLVNTAKASEKLPNLADSFQETMDNINVASKKAKETFTHTSTTMENFNSQVLPETMDALESFNGLMKRMKGLAGELKNNPSILIRGRAKPTPGPGE